MLRIMANENFSSWGTTPTILHETVFATKHFLERELKRYASWEETRSDKIIRSLFASEPQFRTVKGVGVGRDTILKFLSGPWKQWQVQEARCRERKSRLGELIKRQKETVGLNRGTAGLGRPNLGGARLEPPKILPTLAEAGISKKLSARSQKLAIERVLLCLEGTSLLVTSRQETFSNALEFSG